MYCYGKGYDEITIHANTDPIHTCILKKSVEWIQQMHRMDLLI